MNTIQIPKKGSSTIVGIAIPVGSRMESNNIKGISHFIEHMCLSGDSYIDTPNGRKYIKQLNVGDKVYSVKVKNNYSKYNYTQLQISKVNKIYKTNSKYRLHIYLQSGKIIKTTYNHPFAKINKNNRLNWTIAEQLNKGDILFARKDLSANIKEDKDIYKLYKIGYILGYCYGDKIIKIIKVYPLKFSKNKEFINYNLTIEPNNNFFVNGILVHNCFKGTKTRTTKQIAFEIEQYGGILNAFTDYELTCYWACIDNKHKQIAINVLKDLVLNPIFLEIEINKEREVIKQELNRYQDNPGDYVYDLFNKKYFTKNSSFYASIVGTHQSLNNINRTEILKHYKKYYKEKNMTMIIIGDIKSKVNYHCPQKSIYNFKDIKNKKLSTFFKKRKDIGQANIIIGNYFKSKNPWNDYFSMVLLASIYNDMSGRLFTEIREKHHLVYGINFYFEMYSDNTVQWGIILGLTKNKIKKAHALINKELMKKVNSAELKYAFTKIIGDTKLYFDNKKNIMNAIAYDPKDYKEYLYNYEKHLKKVAKNINQFIKKINLKKNVIIGVIPK